LTRADAEFSILSLIQHRCWIQFQILNCASRAKCGIQWHSERVVNKLVSNKLKV